MRALRFSLASKIFLGVASIIVVFGGVSSYGLYRMARYHDEVTILVKGLTPLTHEVREILRSTDGLVFSLNQADPQAIVQARNFLSYLEPFRRLEQMVARVEQRRKTLPLSARQGTEAFLKKTQGTLTRLVDGEQFYRIASRDNPARLAMLEPLLAGDLSNRNTFLHVFNYFLDKLERSGTSDRMARELIQKFLQSTKRGLTIVQRDLHRFSGTLREEIDREEMSSLLTILVMSIVALVLGLVILFGTHYTLRRIARLIEGVRVLSSGNYASRIEVHSGDEIGQLAEEFNSLVGSLEERDHELASQSQRLLRSERLAVIGKMASFIAHEVRNPLSSIALNTEMLQEEAEDRGAEPESRLLKAIMDEVDRLKDVTEQYLQFARMPTPERMSFPVANIVDSMLSLQTPELLRLGIKVDLDLDRSSRASVDVNQVRQALVNLSSNAMEALRERPDPRLAFTISRVDGFVEVAVSDNGGGIPEAVRERVTEPFFTTRSAGTGLGLPICQEIAERHGGEMQIDSRDGEGTTVTLRFPEEAGEE